jgi:hypothetical protein
MEHLEGENCAKISYAMKAAPAILTNLTAAKIKESNVKTQSTVG